MKWKKVFVQSVREKRRRRKLAKLFMNSWGNFGPVILFAVFGSAPSGSSFVHEKR